MRTSISRVMAGALILSATAGCAGTTDPTSKPPTDAPSVTAVSTPVASTSSTSPTASTVAPPVPSEGPIQAGTYRVDPGPWTAVGYTLTMPEGWVAQNGGETLSKHPDEPGEVGVNPFVVTDIFADACGPDDLLTVGPTASDLVTALERQAGPETSVPTAVTLGGYPATSLQLTIPAGLDPTTCDPPIGLQIWHSAQADTYMVVIDDATVTVTAADVNGARLVLSTQALSGSTADDIAEMKAIVASVRVQP